MKIKIRYKILITICSLVLLSLVGQVVFNLFFSKSFFIGQQKDIITEAYDEIAEDYSSDLTAVNEIGERLQDTYGIKTMISDGGKVVYSSGYSIWTLCRITARRMRRIYPMTSCFRIWISPSSQRSHL